ncbi:MAG: hypothetical protein AB9866_11040 [Syntrophobacteraceae bacterium]
MLKERGKPYVRRLSDHFVGQWKTWIGATPTVKSVNDILAESTKLNGQRRVLVPQERGGTKPDKIIAQYWNHRIDVIIRIDTDDGTAVTIITPAKAERSR